ncbi:MAG: adenine phosphoribosyltransferase [Actinomycetota bacterium]
MEAPGAPDHGWLKDLVRDVPDFPKPGVVFKDITPLLGDARAFVYTIEALAAAVPTSGKIDKVLGIEARGFMIAAPLAYRERAGLVPVRKKGKLPWHVEAMEYQLEYGADRLEIHKDAIAPGEEVLIVDDVLATGGTARATASLVESCGGRVAAIATLMELTFLEGRRAIEGYPYVNLISY